MFANHTRGMLPCLFECSLAWEGVAQFWQAFGCEVASWGYTYFGNRVTDCWSLSSHRGSFLADEQGLGGSAFSQLSASRQAWARVWMRSSGHVLCPWPSVILSLPLRKTGLFSDKPPSERFVLNGGDSGETGKCFVLGHRIETADLRRSACCS